MSQPKDSEPPGAPRSDDLKDWVAIGMIIVASSLLLWVPLFIEVSSPR